MYNFFFYIFGVESSVGRSMLRIKGCCKRDMATFYILSSQWEQLAEDRTKWRRLIHEGQSKHDNAWFNALKEKRTRR